MTQTVSSGVVTLRAAMAGPVVVPGDLDYDERRRVWNADINRRPAVIARCISAADVAKAIRFGREQGLEITVRGGAHSFAGASICDDGLMIDLSLLNKVSVAPEVRRAQVGGGALLADMDAATQAHGLAVPAGIIGHTGVGGLSLGGGMGWLTRKFGLSIDNLVGAEVVTADGRILQVAAEEHPDLFWALRGGGGNFGVVTSFEFGLHELDPMVQFGLFFWGLDQGPAALRLAREIVATMPLDVNAIVGGLNAPPAPFVPEQHHFAPGYVLLLAGFNGTTDHAPLVSRIRQTVPPLFDMVTPMPFVALQTMLDEAAAWGSCAYEKTVYVADLSDPVIEAVTEHVPRKSAPMGGLLCYPLDGAYSQVGGQDTAFSGGRSPRLGVFIVGMAPDSAVLVAERTWARNFWEALRPHAIGSGDEAYVNALIEFGEDRLRAAYGSAKYDKLARIKAIYDPDNVFHHNANIKPA
jgi:FAD binding domain/Berberine and berberine like